MGWQEDRDRKAEQDRLAAAATADGPWFAKKLGELQQELAALEAPVSSPRAEFLRQCIAKALRFHRGTVVSASSYGDRDDD